MLFNSLGFMCFFPLVTLIYFILPHRFRWQWLLAISCYFYMSFVPIYILILAVTITIDYFAALLIEKAQGKTRRQYLLVSIIATCAVLAVFKYFNFFNGNIRALADVLHLNYSVGVLELILPIGLSFHTFQSLSYVIEVYRGHQKAERHFGIYFLYVMFYPQLVAGPIERPQNLLHQFREHHQFEYQRVANGLKLMAWGMFMKVVIADRLALLVNTVYGNPHSYDGPAFIIATVFFAFQIYCDFAGYSNIAIGSAEVMGFRLMDNFNRPYASRSISQFWRRWHISLSTWFKDYLYVPLGGNRVSRGRQYFNLLLTFTISGFWHGANWTYIVWGILNGIYLLLEHATYNIRASIFRIFWLNKIPGLGSALGIISTFILICYAWIYFRANSVSEAWYISSHISQGIEGLLDIVWWNKFLTIQKSGLDGFDFGVVLIAISFMEFFHYFHRESSLRHILEGRSVYLRYFFYCFLVTSIMVFGAFSKPQQFIYFQF